MNSRFGGIVNIPQQIPQIDVADLSANIADINNLTVDNLTVDNLTVDDLTVDDIKAGDGTVALPSYSFTSDPNTGLYRPVADTIGFSAGGIQQATINTTTHLSVHEGGPAAPSINFIGNLNTGIYSQEAAKMGVSTGGALEVSISTLEHLSVQDGDVTNPAINFISDTNTGMYRVQDDTIGLSVNGEQKVTVVSSGAAPLGMIEGLNVGTTSGNVCGIQRLSAIAANSWQDGHMGNSSSLVFTPSDFLCANPTPGAGVGAITSAFVNICSNANGWNQTGGSRFGTPSLCTATGADVIIATKLIPKGFTISETDTITIYGLSSLTTTRVAVACRNVDNPIAPSATVGNACQLIGYTFNTPQALTGITGITTTIPTGDGTSMIIIYINPGVQLTTMVGGITGASITMSRI
jgi:hypothetical protein